jgi:hypothetical protein
MFFRNSNYNLFFFFSYFRVSHFSFATPRCGLLSMIRAGEMKLSAHRIKSIEQKLKERCADSSPLHLRWRVFNKTIVNDADTLKYLNQVSLILNSTFQTDRVLDTDRDHLDFMVRGS